MELKDLIWNMSVYNSDPTGNVNKDFETVDNLAIQWLGQRNDLPFSQVYPTDYAVLCGARLTDENCGPFIKKGSWSFTRTIASNKNLQIERDNDNLKSFYIDNTDSCVRPMVCLKANMVEVCRRAQKGENVPQDFADMLKKYPFDFNPKVLKNAYGNQYGRTVDMGEYPNTAVKDAEQIKTLEQAVKNGAIKETGRNFFAYFDKNKKGQYFKEVEYMGQKYVRIVPNMHQSTKTYADGEKIETANQVVWVKVEPIKWLIINWGKLPKGINPLGNGKDDFVYLISLNGIISGLPYYRGEDKNNLLWQNSTIRGFLNGINVNNITSNGNVNFTAPNGGNFEKFGFIDVAFNETNFVKRTALNVASKTSSQAPKTNTNNLTKTTIKKENQKKESTIVEKTTNKKFKSRLDRLNPDTTKKSDREILSDTQKIRNWIDAGSSVLLRGPSGIGKTERLKSMYPNLIYIKLTNNMFPEKVVGSMNLQTGQSIPPDFAKEAILQCATESEQKLVAENIQNLFDIAGQVYERSKNSDEKVVILLDELLNVKPAVQSLVYTLVLNKLVETGKGLKLPANTVVVATGNQKKYSNVAEDLAEPLEKRFDHILDMEPKVSEWIDEYALTHNVHPVVVSYIWSNYIKNGNKDDIDSIGYFYEEPEVGEANLDQNGCRGRTNDPRGWVSISNSLYAFEKDLKAGKFIGKDVEDILQSLIGSKLRADWAVDFYNFYNSPTLTVDEVCSQKFTTDDLPKTVNDKFAYVTALLPANINQVKECREFIKKYCSPEYLSLYDIYWARKNEKRMEKLAELDEESWI